MDLNNYRIKRVDPKNIAIQRRQSNKIWVTISYHGNSINSLISGLFELISTQYTPEAESVSGALADLKLELVSGIEEVKKMVERYCDE